MNDQELSKYLSMLGYTTKWEEHGLLTRELLLDQISAFHKSEDKHTEHYRYAAFRNYLAAKETLTNPEFDNYIEIALADQDRVMAGAALIDLFTKTHVSDDQFDKLIAHLKELGDWTKNTVTRQSLLRKLKQDKLTDEFFRECLEQGDAMVQEYLITLANTEQLTLLSVQGQTKRVRNMASQYLNR